MKRNLCSISKKKFAKNQDFRKIQDGRYCTCMLHINDLMINLILQQLILPIESNETALVSYMRELSNGFCTFYLDSLCRHYQLWLI